MRLPRRPLQWFLVAAVTLFAGGMLAAAGTGFHLVGTPSSGPAPATGAIPGTPQRFAQLASAHTNACSLQRSTVDAYPDDQRIQGSCCNAMDPTKYRYQVEQLRHYAGIPEIPSDPYDIRAGLAKRLFRLDDTIRLSGVDQRTFDRVMQMTEDKAPCCCHCWRWDAAEGLDRFLITRHHLGAAEVARITDLVNGCGGPMETPPSAAPGSNGST